MKTGRHIYLLSATAAILTAVACTHVEPSRPAAELTDVPVLFDSPVMHRMNTKAESVGAAPKAAETGENPRNVLYSGKFPTNWSFCVEGRYYQGTYPGWDKATLHMPQVEVLYDGGINPDTDGIGAWSSDPAYYWVKNTKMAFQAFSPFSIKSENGVSMTSSGLQLGAEASGTMQDTYYAAQTDGTQADIMYADRIKDIENSSNSVGTSYDGIQLQFRHAMSAIRFAVQTNGRFDAGTTVRLKQITLSGVCHKGIFRQIISDDGTAMTASWTKLSGSETDRTSYQVINSQNDKYGKKGVLLGGGEGYKVPNWYGRGTEEENPKDFHNPSVNDLVLIPQDITEDMEIRIDYQLEIGTSIVQDYWYEAKLSDLVFKYADDSEAPQKFEMGHLYTFNIMLGMQIIRFEPVVDAWDGILLMPDPVYTGQPQVLSSAALCNN